MRTWGRGVAAVIALALIGPVGASAATVTVGQTASSGSLPDCSDTSQHLQQAVAEGAGYTVPSAGTITSWSHYGRSPAAGSGRLVVWRPTGAVNQFTVVATSAVVAFTPNALTAFAVSIPVAAGDVVGLRSEADVGCFFVTGNAADRMWHSNTGAPEPVVGGSFTFLDPLEGDRVNVSAVLQTPEAPPPPTRSLTVAYKAKKAFKGAVSSNTAPCLATKVKVLRKKPGPDKKVGQDQTDASGLYKVKERNADDGKYYASVAAEGTCPAARSKTVKVR